MKSESAQRQRALRAVECRWAAPIGRAHTCLLQWTGPHISEEYVAIALIGNDPLALISPTPFFVAQSVI